MRKTIRRGGIVTTGMVAALALATGTAFAHECINASRGAQGNHMAGTRSQAWYEVVIADEVAWEVEMGFYSAEEGECMYEYWLDNGGPESFTVHVKGANGQDGVVAGRNPNTHLLHDGRGIDLVDDLFPLYLEAAEACGVEFPEFE